MLMIVVGVFATLRAVPKKEGFLGLYKGNGAMMIRIFPYGAIQFLAFDYYRKVFFLSTLCRCVYGLQFYKYQYIKCLFNCVCVPFFCIYSSLIHSLVYLGMFIGSWLGLWQVGKIYLYFLVF